MQVRLVVVGGELVTGCVVDRDRLKSMEWWLTLVIDEQRIDGVQGED